jgi:aromatic ring-opening dioxygenase LigB subunit
MVVGGIVLPHPPIILSGFAGDRGAEVDGTIEAVQRACRWLAFDLRPGRLVIASPHVGHGFDVPLAFLEEVLGELPATDRLLTLDPYERYVELGRELRATEASVPIRTAIVASGDCSHRLRPDGPYGFHEAGPALDRAIQGGLRSGRAEELLAIDRDLVERGSECGLRSFVFALAAVQPTQVDVLSYECPYGVGYLVAILGSEAQEV